MKNTVTNTNLYQPKLLYDFKISYENDIPSDDISRTVVEVVEGANILRYVDFSNRNSYGYDGMLMLEAVILAFSIYGYASTRQLESLCRYDIRFKFIMRGDTPSHMAFQRFLSSDLCMPLEDIFHELNRYIEKNDTIDTSILYIDGSKFEANFSTNDLLKFANARQGLYSRARHRIINYLLPPNILGMRKADRPGLVNPLIYYLSN